MDILAGMSLHSIWEGGNEWNGMKKNKNKIN
jgi:hypothetical protein